MAEAVGPVFTGGFEEITTDEQDHSYKILYLPDKHNDDLQREGKAPVYYWMPNQVRLAQQGDTGDYKFHLVHFVGVRNEDTTVGVEGTEEVAGGVLSLTTTAGFPGPVLQASHDALLNRFRGKDLRYWGWRTSVAPMFRPMPILDSQLAITNLAPQSDGTVAGLTGDADAGGSGSAASTDGGSNGGSGGSSPPAPRLADRLDGQPRIHRIDDPTSTSTRMPRTVPHGRAFRAPSNLDAWYWNIGGQGPGSVDPSGENAFSGLIGSLPAAIVWQGFHGTYSPIVVTQALKLKVWSQTLRLVIRGEWERIFRHFSAHARGRYAWFSADIKAEINQMMIDGAIEVELEIDGTLPNAEDLRKEANKRIDLILEKFMEQAKQRIFDPAPPDVSAAEADRPGSGFLGFGAGFSLAAKFRQDSTTLNLSFEETVNEMYLQDHVISSSLRGFFDEIKEDPEAERKYFTTLYLDDWDRQLSRIVKPVVNWPDPSQRWVGDPVAFLSAQVGYPDTNGAIQWASHAFSRTDAEDETWTPVFTMKQASDVTNPPEGWQPDLTFVKRKVHFLEPPGESDNPFMRVFVEKNEVELDTTAGSNGSLTNENILEVRADSVGKLEVGPIALNVELENSRQTVTVEFQAQGQTHDGRERGATRFIWNFDDQIQARYWEIYTGQPDFLPNYRYRVHVDVKGSIFTKGMSWSGPWIEGSGNGPLMVAVPTPESAGVTTRSLTAREVASEGPVLGSARPEPVSVPPVRRRYGGRSAAEVTTNRLAGPPPSGAVEERETGERTVEMDMEPRSGPPPASGYSGVEAGAREEMSGSAARGGASEGSERWTDDRPSGARDTEARAPLSGWSERRASESD